MFRSICAGVGTVIAYNTVVIRSQIQGQITQIAFNEGQAVRAGDLLAQIDPRPFQAQLDQVIATHDRDQAQLTNALANLDRYNQLLVKGWATPQLAETQQAQVKQLQNAIKADEALIQAARIQLEYTRLTSPIDGVTGVRLVDLGNIIHPTDTNGLVVVTQLTPISVIFTLPETNLPEIQQRMAKGTLKVLAFSQDDKIQLDEGRLGLVDNQIQQTTGTIRLKAEFPEPSASPVARRTDQRPAFAGDAPQRPHRTGSSRATGPERFLRLRHCCKQHGPDAAHRSGANQRRTSVDRSRTAARESAWSSLDNTGCSPASRVSLLEGNAAKDAL